MLTGFHGFHVLVGMLMLLFITLRLRRATSRRERHFGFEGAAWYWHFVDVVWLGLYFLVYWLRAMTITVFIGADYPGRAVAC
jgi:cytochrome c oxidase subunit 3